MAERIQPTFAQPGGNSPDERTRDGTALTVPPPPLLHPIPRAAERLGVSESSIWRLIQKGTLHPTCVLGRTMISESELQRLVSEATKPRRIAPQSVAELDVNTRDTPSPDTKPKSRLRQSTK